MQDWLKTADNIKTLMQADAVCLWCSETQGIAVPVVCAPQAWIERPFVLASSAQEAVRCVRDGKQALPMLPIGLRGHVCADQLEGALDACFEAQPGKTVGLLVVWERGRRVPAFAEDRAPVILAALALLTWKAGASTNLIETHPQMHALAAALPQGIVLVPLDGRMGYANGPAAALLNLPEGEAMPGALSQALNRFVNRTLNVDEVNRYAARILTHQMVEPEQRSMTWRFASDPKALRVTITPIGMPRQTAWAWLIDDVSQETALRDQLASQEQKFRLFYQTLRDAVVLYDLQGHVLEGNAALPVLIGTQSTDITNLLPSQLGWSAQVWSQVLNECLAVGYSTSREREIASATGATITVESVAHLRLDSAGQADGIWEVLHDITARKSAEAQLILSAEAFARHSDGVILTDVHAAILTSNDAFSATCGYSREELRGRKPSIFKSGKHDEKFYARMRHQIFDTGWWQGGVWNRNKAGDLFFKWLSVNAIRDSQGRVTHFIGIYRDASTVKRAQNRIEYLATHDGLTQLPNKVLFEDRLQTALQGDYTSGRMLAVLLIALDGLQQVNSALGYRVGDALLKEVAARLRETCIKGQMASRLSGDKFGVLLAVSSLEALVEHCERFFHQLNLPHLHQGSPMVLPVFMGVSVCPSDGNSVESLLLKADAALHRAKQLGSHGYQFFAEEMAQTITHRFDIENGLRLALERQELFLQYQAQVLTADGTVGGCEALLRWRRGTEVVPPGVFIPIAEMSSLIVPITEWVLRQACRDLRRWDEHGVHVHALSVNISAKHFLSEKMVPSLLEILEEEQVSPERVCLEITEGALADPAHCERKLTALKQAGFSLSIDDFGTGFSSLSYLKRFRLDELKIDRSFVKGIDGDSGDRAIVAATLSMAHSLGMRVVAEGVEVQSQADYLKAHGCELMQGYLFTKAVDTGQFEAFARSRQPPPAEASLRKPA